MKSTLCCLLVTLLVFLPFGESYIRSVTARHPSYPGQCYFYQVPDPIVLPFGGSKVLLKQCEQVQCQPEYQLMFYGCSIPKVPPNCRITRDVTRVYPHCCPQIKCS